MANAIYGLILVLFLKINYVHLLLVVSVVLAFLWQYENIVSCKTRKKVKG